MIFTNKFLVGVNDSIVGEYFSELHQLYLTLKPVDKDPIKFHSLVDIFSLKTSNFDTTLVDGVVLNHYLDTEIDLESELCRKILEASCDTDCGGLKRDIHTPDHPRLYLYRGFARFMEEDLAMHPIVRGSRKRFKKIVSKVAFEMIKVRTLYFCLNPSIIGSVLTKKNSEMTHIQTWWNWSSPFMFGFQSTHTKTMDPNSAFNY